MRPRDAGAAIAVAAIWGVNFVMIDLGLQTLPPLLFSALRFALAAFPALLFVGAPKVAWRWVIAVGLSLGVVKFSLLFAGMNAGMPAGLSSLVLQAKAIFTLLFAAVLLGERPGRRQLAGLSLAAAGIALVAWRLGPQRPADAFALVLAAAVAWGGANIAIRKAAPADMLNFMVWVSAVAAPPLMLLSLVIEGPAADLVALRSLELASVGALAYIAGLSTLVGFGVWGALIRRHGAATVAPFSMLVPFFGMTSAALVLGERLHLTDVLGAVLVVSGVLFGVLRRSTPSPVVQPLEPARPPVAGAPAAPVP
ncbi:MAG TPA: EamA family transporter [Micromonosporaceae bacterium]